MSRVFPPVPELVDHESTLNAQGLTPPLAALRERTDYLRHRLDSLDAASGGRVVIQGAVLPADLIDVGTAVYQESATGLFRRAVALLEVSADYRHTVAAESAGVRGVVSQLLSSDSVEITIFGDLNIDLTDLQRHLDNELPVSGRHLYASASVPGLLTSRPAVPYCYVGTTFHDTSTDSWLLSIAPNVIEAEHPHRHMDFVLGGIPAGHPGAVSGGRLSCPGFKTDGGNAAGIRLRVLDAGLAKENTTYTFTLEGTGAVGATVLKWRTDNGSDDDAQGNPLPGAGSAIGTAVYGFGIPINIGTRGIRVIIDPGSDYSAAAVPDWSLTDVTRVYSGSPVEADRRWTVLLPQAARGWRSRIMQQTLLSANGLLLLGRRVNPNEDSVVTVDLASAGGDMSSGVAATITIGADVYNLTLLRGRAIRIGSTDLWVFCNDYSSAGSLVSTTLAATSVSVTYTDGAPGAPLEYSTDADLSLQLFYPPSPLEGVELQLNGVALAARDRFAPGSGSYTAAVDGLYWWGDVSSFAPWPLDFVSYANQGDGETRRNILLRFASNTSANGIVNSLVAAKGSALVIRRRGGAQAGSVGDLEIDINLALQARDTNAPGYRAVKGVAADGTLLLGQLVEQLVQGEGISIEQLSPGADQGAGRLRISASGGELAGEFTNVNLSNGKWERVPNQALHYLRLLGWDSNRNNNQRSGFTAQFRVPQDLRGSYKVVFSAAIFGLLPSAQLARAGLKISYSILPDLRAANDPTTDVFVPANVFTGSYLTGIVNTGVHLGPASGAYTAGDPVLFHNDPDRDFVAGQVNNSFGATFPVGAGEAVAPGHIVAIHVDRAPADSAPEYIGDIGFLNLRWRLVTAG